MNGVHDMGGMDGFGPVLPERNEPVFHARWEGRVYGLMASGIGMGRFNIDESRHAMERMPPARYLASSYYERWLAGAETMLVEHGVVTREELLARYAAAGIDATSIPRAVQAAGPPPAKETPGAKSPGARFAKRDRVRARNINPSGHTRLPRYVRGKRGVIAHDWGVFVFADTNAHHAGEKRQHCYSVAFDARELWGKPARSRERIYIDLWEDYLEPDGSNSKSKSRRRVAKRKRAGRSKR